MSETTDILAIALPSAVALAAIGSAVWQQRRGLSHERSIGDLADARTVIDEAAVALHHASYARARETQAFMKHGEFVHDRAGDVLREGHEAGAALDALQERLTVRFGAEHPAVERFQKAAASLLPILRLLGVPQESFDPQKTWQAMQREGTRFEEGRREFMIEATALVGSKLP